MRGGASGESADGGGSGGGEAGAGLMKKGPWTAAEDAILVDYVRKHGEGNWNTVQKNSGLSRCGKSCRLRWANHLRPNLKKGSFSPDEELLILRLHAQLGNKWARMAAQLPGRTDNEIKNYWNTRIKRRQRAGLSLYPPEVQRQAVAFHRQNQQQQRPSPSPTTTPPPTPTPFDHKAHFPATPLSLFDPVVSFPMAPVPLLASNPFSAKPHLDAPQIKRFRDDGLMFHFPLSPASPHTPPTLPLYHHQHHQQPQPQPQPQRVQYNSGKFDLFNPLPQPPLSMKMELPSNQYFTEPAGSGGGDGSGGLLEALLQEAQGLGNLHKAPPPLAAWDQDDKWAPSGGDRGRASQPPALVESGSKLDHSDRCFGIKMETKPTDEMINPGHDDISALLDMIPATTMPPTPGEPGWYNSPSGEMSNGPSSVVTDTDDIGLEMQQLASSLSIAPMDAATDWNTGSCTWNNMPGIC